MRDRRSFLILAGCAGLAGLRASLVPARAELSFGARLSQAAIDRLALAVVYDPAYRRIPYPGGDVPLDRGVCADEIVRAYRALGVDLQVGVHEDMKRAFAQYPRGWGLSAPDSNIDHRRVPNLERFFERQGAALPARREARAYRAGDVVSWRLGGRVPHIGIVTHRRTRDGARPLIEHNIGAGPQLADALFAFPLAGHFRYWPQPARMAEE